METKNFVGSEDGVNYKPGFNPKPVYTKSSEEVGKIRENIFDDDYIKELRQKGVSWATIVLCRTVYLTLQ